MQSHVADELEAPITTNFIEQQRKMEKAVFDKFEKRIRRQIYGTQEDLKTPPSTPARLKIQLSKPTIVTTQNAVIIHNDDEAPPMPGNKRLSRPECDILANILSRRNKTCADQTTKWAISLSILLTIIVFASKTLNEDDYGEKFLFGIVMLASIRALYQLLNHCKSPTVDDLNLPADVVNEFLRERTAFSIISTRLNNEKKNFRTIITSCASHELKQGELGAFESSALESLDQCTFLTKKISDPNKTCFGNKILTFFSSARPSCATDFENVYINHPKPEGAYWTDDEFKTIAWLPGDPDFPQPRVLVMAP